MEKIVVRITGESPLLMHSARLSNPFDPITKAHKVLTSKRKKTEEDQEAIARSEWEGGMYHDGSAPYLPGMLLKAALRDGAKLSRGGKDVSRAVRVLEDKLPLEYNGPKSVESLWADGGYFDIRSVAVQRARLMRCRPIFREWSVEATIMFLPDQIERVDVLRYLENAGQLIGVGDFRPDKGGDFGRFSVEVIQ